MVIYKIIFKEGLHGTRQQSVPTPVPYNIGTLVITVEKEDIIGQKITDQVAHFQLYKGKKNKIVECDSKGVPKLDDEGNLKWKTAQKEARKIEGGDTENGEVSFAGLDPGWYTIYESDPPEGYKSVKQERFTEVEIAKDGSAKKLEYKYEKENDFNRKIEITKIDKDHPNRKQKDVIFTVRLKQIDSKYEKKFKEEFNCNPNDSQ